MEEDKSLLTKILLFLFFFSLITIGFIYLFMYLKSPKLSAVNSTQKNKNIEKKNVGYNFVVPQTNSSQSSTNSDFSNQTVDTQVDDEILTPEEKRFAFNYNVAEGQSGTIIIPAINVNANILDGSNGDKLLDEGFWHYPATNLPGTGETILLCHRRHFNANDSRSCWNLNLLKTGDLIQLNDNSGKPIRYIVTNNVVKPQEDVNIFQVSKDHYLKIITCSLGNGKAGGSTHRIVVIAKEV